MKPCKVKFVPGDVTAEVDADKPAEGVGLPGSLLNIAEGSGVEIEHPCEGVGTCGLCGVTIEEGMDHLSLPTPDEEDVLDQCVHGSHSRLSCQAVVEGDVVCRVGG